MATSEKLMRTTKTSCSGKRGSKYLKRLSTATNARDQKARVVGVYHGSRIQLSKAAYAKDELVTNCSLRLTRQIVHCRSRKGLTNYHFIAVTAYKRPQRLTQRTLFHLLRFTQTYRPLRLRKGLSCPKIVRGEYRGFRILTPTADARIITQGDGYRTPVIQSNLL